MPADLSVVICSLNGAAGLDRCLRALAAQTGPAELEIIVVDDGSTDDTSDIAQAHGATVIRHTVNCGLAAARNSGFLAASAPIVAFLDDDCEPEPQWAQGLLDAYEDGVVGVGGVLLPHARAGFMLGYLKRHNPLVPLEIDLAKSQKLPYRLYLYLRRHWRPAERCDQRDVYSLVGANMSFRRTVLRETGFDERFRFGAEDTDFCVRLARDFPSARLVVTPDARVKHHFLSSPLDALRRSRSYGRGCARLYRKWPSMRPTIFPGPVLVLAVILASVFFPALLAAAVVLPLLMYPRGLRLAVTGGRPACALDAYVELAEEAWGNAGYVAGLWRFRHLIPETSAPPTATVEFRGEPQLELQPKRASISVAKGLAANRRGAASALRKALAVQLAGLALIAVLTPLHRWWAVQVLLVPLLLIVPGVILLRALRVPGRAVVSLPVYVPAASLVVLLGSGLAVDLVGPRVGVAAPLRAGPLLVGIEVICLVLTACSVTAPSLVDIPWGSLSRPTRLVWPLLLPMVAAAGAMRLNSGHSNAVAVIAVIAVILLLVSAFLFAPNLDNGVLAVIVYAAGLAMMWSFSLRGNLVYGFDIANEYYSMHQTVITGIWHTAQPGNAYAAMLSVTVLPAELHALSGVPDLLVFKVAYPAIGALFPVMVFGLACRVLSRRWAFVAAAFIVMQNTFFQQLPALARQEIALVLFAALIAAVLDAQLPRRSQWALVGLLALGMVVSHYSTTYLAIPLLAIAAALQWAFSWFRRIPHVTGSVLIALAVALGGAVAWYGPVTQTTSSLSQFFSTAEGQGINLLPNNTGNLISTYLEGESSVPLSPAQYEQFAHQYYAAHDAFVRPLPDSGEAQYALGAAPPSDPPVTSTQGNNTLNAVDLILQQLTNLLAALGALLLALRRNASLIARRVGVFGLAALVILALTRVSGTIAEAYNPERAFLQAMVVLGITLCWPLEILGTRWRRVQPAVLAVSLVSLAAFLAGSAGLNGVVVGGGTATNLADSGTDYQQFYMTTQEIASAAWLMEAAQPDQLIYADRYGQLRLITVGGQRPAVYGDITPLTLDQYAWVYASRTNIVDNTVRSALGNDSGTYAFPTRFLDQNYDTVYTNGSSKVFHR